MFIYSSGVITEDKVDQHPSKQEGGGEGDFDAECNFPRMSNFSFFTVNPVLQATFELSIISMRLRALRSAIFPSHFSSHLSI